MSDFDRRSRHAAKLLSPEDVALVGDEAALDAALDRLEASGVTEFVGAPFAADGGAVERTRAYLADRAV